MGIFENWGKTEEEVNGTYRAYVECDNCKDNTYENIKRGITVDMMRHDKVCKNCGCMMLQGRLSAKERLAMADEEAKNNQDAMVR